MNSGFESNTRRTFFKLKKGAIVITIRPQDRDAYESLIDSAMGTETYMDKNGNEKFDLRFSSFTGTLVGISQNDVDFGDTTFKVWNVTFINPDGEAIVWSTSYQGYAFQGFINCIASIEGEIGELKLKAWSSKKDDYDHLTIYRGAEKLGWKYSNEELPAVTTVQIIDPKTKKPKDLIDKVTGKPVKDYTARMEFFEELVLAINNKLHGLEEVEAGDDNNFVDSAPGGDDLPF